jgi:uncharacterized UBP type Zn finger protein
MELRQNSLRACSICSTETYIEEASIGVGLSVDLPDPNDYTAQLFSDSRVMLSLQDILNRFFIESEVVAFCSACNNNTSNKRKVFLAEPPEILLVQAKLFYFQDRTSKKKNVVIEPNDVFINSAGSDGMHSVLYRAYAVVAHVGDSLQTGHYVTIACGSGCSARNPSCGSQSGCWWLFDDQDVSGPMSKQKALELLTQQNVSFWSILLIRIEFSDS